jgi:putative transposase
MPQSLSAVFVHLIFSSKNRDPLLAPRALAMDMHSYLAGISSRLGCHPVLINGVEDHVHLLVRLSRTVTQADLVKELKRASTLWLREQSPDNAAFSWQAGYGIFSVSVSNLDQVKDYIARQEEHHRKVTFQEELRLFLQRHQLEWEEDYVWD